jgi:mannose-6-phosphate isomerase-like protein (cupin superfamily)
VADVARACWAEHVRVLATAGRFSGPEPGEAAGWAEHLRVADLSVGTYSIPAGGADEQAPHTEDEIYVITAGRATLLGGPDRVEVQAGSVVYVPAGEVHRFVDITADLAAIVVFAPAEYTREPSA